MENALYDFYSLVLRGHSSEAKYLQKRKSEIVRRDSRRNPGSKHTTVPERSWLTRLLHIATRHGWCRDAVMGDAAADVMTTFVFGDEGDRLKYDKVKEKFDQYFIFF